MSGPADHTPRWEWLALAAAAFIVIAVPAYLLLDRDAEPGEAIIEQARFVGSTECRDCHLPEWDSWVL